MPNSKVFRMSLAAASALLLTAGASLPAAATEPGWYIGFSAGESEIVNPEALEDICADVGIDCGAGDADTGFKGIVGYQMNPYVAFEGAYFDMGEPSLTTQFPIPGTATANLRGGSFSVLPQIPLGTVGAIFGRLGLAAGDVEVVATVPSLGRTESASATGATFIVGVGGAINLGRNVTFRAEWQRYAIDQTLELANINVDTPDIDFFAGTLIIRFPK